HQVRDLVRAQAEALEHFGYLGTVGGPGGVVPLDTSSRNGFVVDPQNLHHRSVERVGERSVTEVVEKPRGRDPLPRRSLETEPVGHLARDPEGPERMLEAGMVRAGKDEVRESGLPDPPQPLELP